MSETVPYRSDLTRCGIIRDVHMVVESEGLTSLEEIELVIQSGLQRMLKSLQERKRMDEDSGKDLPQLVISLTAEMKFLGLHKWIRTHQRCRNTLTATNFTAAKVRDDIEDKKEDNDDLIKSPKQLSAHDKWPLYKKLIENYLDTKKGMEGAPLSYVIRKDDAATAHTTELTALKTNHDRLIKGSEMSGTPYETDNG
eukprot:15336854-Ditylum_brightwellii.AAC.1